MMKIWTRLKNLITLRRLLIFVAISAVIWCSVVLVLTVLIWSYGGDNQAQEADVIVVLGSGLRRNGTAGDALTRRSRWGADLYFDGYAPVILCAGGYGYKSPRSEASACRDVLLAEGVPDDVIYLEENSKSTEENAINTQKILEDEGWEDIILVTDSFHMLRAQWIFSDQGIKFYRSPVPGNQVLKRYFIRHFIREIVALHWQAAKDVFDLPFTRVDVF